MVAQAGFVLAAAVVLAACASGGEASDTQTATSVVDTTASPSATTTPATTVTTAPATTTTLAPEPVCVVTVAAGDSLSQIADDVGDITIESIREENLLTTSHVIHPGDELDVCIGNDVDDVTGVSKLPPGPAAVRRQQRLLNDLFAPYRIADLVIDGDSGRMTRQMLSAARMGLGLRVSATDMSEGSPEEEALFAAESLSIPDGAATWASRWILIDRTCQVMFVGEGDDRIVNVYPTSTGESGFETRPVQGVGAFRFDPALQNGGWHDSSRFPVEIDDPLNGNMYKPIYFNGGQAIHGAGYVPPEPRSKGCARTFPWHQDELIAWLGLDDVTAPTWREGQIGVTVTVQGEFRPVD